jgi:hypothetical protein
MRVPGFVKNRPVRKIWFEKNFPKAYKALNKYQRAVLLMKGGTLYTKAQLKDMGENERKIAEQRVEEDARKRRKKMKSLAGKIPVVERVSLRTELIDKISAKRVAVLRRADRIIKLYSSQYQKWSGKRFYSRLIGMISSDLSRLYNYYIAARTVRHFKDVTDLYDVLNTNLKPYAEVKKEAVPLKAVTREQVKLFAPLIELGAFDFKDFTKKSGARLKKYMKKKKMRPAKKLPIKISEIVHNEWVAVEKYKEWRKDQPTINADFLKALNTPTEELLKQVRLEETGELTISKMSLSKKVALLNAVYVKFASPFSEKVRKNLMDEKLNFDKKYLSTTSDIVGTTVKVPLEKSDMVVLSKGSKKKVMEMAVEKLQEHCKQIEEDVRYSPKYKVFVGGIIEELSELDKELVKIGLDPVMDVDPITQLKFKDLTPNQKVNSWRKGKKAVEELGRRLERMGLKPKSRLRFGDGEKDVKRLKDMTFTEKSRFIARVEEKHKKKKAEKEEIKRKAQEKKRRIKELAKPKIKMPKKVKSKRSDITGDRFNMRVKLDYDVSGKVLNVWNVAYFMTGRDKKWASFVPTRKRETKRGRKIVKSLIVKLTQMEGIRVVTVTPDEKDIPTFVALSFKPITDKARVLIKKESGFSDSNISDMKFYLG